MAEQLALNRFDDGIETLLNKALQDLGASWGSLMVIDHKEKVLRIKVTASRGRSGSLDSRIIKKTRLKVGDGIAGIVARTGKPLLINDIGRLKKTYPGLKTSTDASRYESSLVVPIMDNGSSIGVLNINNKLGGGVFSKIDLSIAEMLGEYCGIALKLERQNSGMLVVNEIIREISMLNNLPDIYKLVITKGADIVECVKASLMLVEREPDGAHYLVVKESTDGSILGQRRRLGESVSGYVWKTGEPVLIKSVEDGVKDRRFRILNKPGSFIVVPLNLKYRSPYALNVALKSVSTIGVLNFTQRHDGAAFTSEQLEAIINYSNLVAIAIEKARYFNDSKVAYLSTVKALSAALGSKDRYTKDHSDSVEALCAILADRMGLSDKEKEDLQIAALLHDIGKIGIPEEILNKKGKLTKAEYKKIKTHIEEAENILMHTFYLDDSRFIIRNHHERYDGSGYPDGLKGKDIPLSARILAAADAFHAMTSDRPYRDAMPVGKAVKEFMKCRGKQFDPQIVDLLLETLNEQYPGGRKEG